MEEKIKRDEIIDRMLDGHPDLRSAEKRVFVLLIIYAVIRVVPAVLQTVYVHSVGGSKTDCLMNYVLILLCGLFAVMVAQGVRFFAILGAMCGGYSVLSFWLDSFLGPYDPVVNGLYYAYLIVLVSVSVIQIFIMIYVMFEPKCKEYLTLLDSVNKDYFDSSKI